MRQIIHAIVFMWQQLSRPLRCFLCGWAILAGGLHASVLILILQASLLQLSAIDNYRLSGLTLHQEIHRLQLTRRQWIVSGLGYLIGTCLFFDGLYFASDVITWQLPQLTTVLARHPFPLPYVLTAMLLMVVLCASQLPCFLSRIQHANRLSKNASHTLRNRQMRGLLVLFYAIFLLVMMFVTIHQLAIFEWFCFLSALFS